jgi:carboxyl-terminal processing protease
MVETMRSTLFVRIAVIAFLMSVAFQPPAVAVKEKNYAKVAAEYIVQHPPNGMAPLTNLSAEQWRDNFEILWHAINITYPCFALKSIDWNDVRLRYEKRLESVTNDGDFYILMFQMMNELKDAHSGLQNYQVPVLPGPGGVIISLIEGKPFVTFVGKGSEIADAGVKPGWEIISVDGLTPSEKVEYLRPFLRASSSERAFQGMAARHLLSGVKGTLAAVKMRSPEGRIETLNLHRDSFPMLGRPERNLPFELTRQRYIDFGRHPLGQGYIWIRTFNGREDLVKEFDHALEQLKDTPGLILDIRDNEGGFGQMPIVSRLLQKRVLVSVSYIKNGPKERDLARSKLYLEPGGPWQYTHPIALLVNTATGSASDLFACWLRSAGRVTTIGTTTHGNLSGVARFIVLPCNLVVRISNGYIADSKDQIVEMNGNEPDIRIEPTITQLVSGKDPVLEKAVELLLPRK